MSYLSKGFSLVRDPYRHLMNAYRLYKHENGGDEIIYVSRSWLPESAPKFRGINPS